MSWNFRVMRHAQVDKESGKVSEWLAFHEVHYESTEVNDLEVTSADVGYTENPVTMTAESVEELRFMLTSVEFRPKLTQGFHPKLTRVKGAQYT